MKPSPSPTPRRRPPGLLALTLLLAAMGAAAQAQPLAAATVSDLRVLPDDRIDGERPSELSGLAWDADAQRLVAVSDRGRLFSFALTVEADRITTLAPHFGGRIGGGTKVNAEALALRVSGGRVDLVVADEGAAQALVIDGAGRFRGHEPLPEALRDPAARHGDNSGVEALGWHPGHGLIAAPQRPLRDTAPGVHRLYAAGRSWAFRAHPGGRSSIKDLVVLDTRRVLVLEKVAQDHGHLTLLREVDLDACAPTAPCDAPAALIRDARLQPEDNFEGLTCLDTERCLLVTDNGGSGPTRTLFALLRLHRR